MRPRTTKIVCTIGPASSSSAQLGALMEAGMDVARLNMSHGSHLEHREVVRHIRLEAHRRDRHVGILMDLSGPKIRLGEVGDGPITLEIGEPFRLTSKKVVGSSQIATISYETLSAEVRIGQTILLNDGAVALRVIGIENEEVLCTVKEAGQIDTHKGVNLPDTALSVGAMTDKDWQDVEFGIQEDVDWIALSFVCRGADIDTLKAKIRDMGADTPVMAKIERREALTNIDDIIDAADGIMVARGDLGVETDVAEMPIVQKRIIAAAKAEALPVVTATQMLESMVEHSRPTRAEVTDVANAILDGTDAIMLSAETAVGAHPVETVRMMARIAKAAEASMDYSGTSLRRLSRLTTRSEDAPITDAVCHGAAQMVHDLGLSAVVTCTNTGYSARMMARFRPSAPILAITPHPQVARRLAISWGVIPKTTRKLETTDQMLSCATDAAIEAGLASEGDHIAVIAGIPFGETGSTNLVKVHEIGTPAIARTP